MSDEQKKQIIQMSKEFAKGFEPQIPKIAGSGWLIVDPLSAYLAACGFEKKLSQLPENEKHPLILVMEFSDGSKFIPAGSDLPIDGATDWLWI
jgi:hypothetical protein